MRDEDKDRILSSLETSLDAIMQDSAKEFVIIKRYQGVHQDAFTVHLNKRGVPCVFLCLTQDDEEFFNMEIPFETVIGYSRCIHDDQDGEGSSLYKCYEKIIKLLQAELKNLKKENPL